MLAPPNADKCKGLHYLKMNLLGHGTGPVFAAIGVGNRDLHEAVGAFGRSPVSSRTRDQGEEPQSPGHESRQGLVLSPRRTAGVVTLSLTTQHHNAFDRSDCLHGCAASRP